MAILPQDYRDRASEFAFQAGKSGPEGIVRVRDLFDREGLRLRLESKFEAKCMRGCASCCHRSVKATLSELLDIVGRMRRNPAMMKAVEPRIRSYVEKMTPSWERMAPTPIERCPFLGPDNDLCAIYEGRPLFCRGWSSSDVHACERHKNHPEAEVPPRSEAEAELCDLLTQAVVSGVAAGGVPSGLFEMASALLLILDSGANLGGLSQEDLERVKVMSEQTLTPTLVSLRIKEAMESAQGKLFLKSYSEESDWDGARAVLTGDAAFDAIHRLAFPRVFESEEEIDGHLVQWQTALEDFAALDGDPRGAYEALYVHDTFPLAYTGRSVCDLLGRHGEVISDLVEKVAPQFCEPVGERSPGRLRIGYISGRLRDFNGARWALGWLKNHSREDVETFAFNLGAQEDAGSHAFRRLADHYFHVPFNPLEVANHIRGLDLDLLIWTDIGMGGVEYQLAPFRLARIQATAWGHPVTSGLPSIDWYLSSDLMEPADADREYTEKLIRLPGSGLTYPPLTGTPSRKSREDFGLGEGTIYLSCQNPMKHHPEFDVLYAEICDRADAEIVFLGGIFKGDLEILKRRFQRAGIRAHWIQNLPAGDYLRLIQLSDVILDAPAWNGGNTTIEALSYSKPVVSLPTRFMRGRHSLAFLTQAQVPGLLATSREDYVSLALDRGRQEVAMQGLRAQDIFMDPAPVRDIERLVGESVL